MGNPTTRCICRNHIGEPKTRHKSKAAALTAIVRRHMRHGGTFYAYPCPSIPGVFHVATQRKRNAA